ncbi:MAG TPA: hypothetical protein DDW50_09225 [Firmicutes bacterium]|jgi:hypothetical protein|nr:hypothetical protein [Bacillota bacterium]
MDSTASIMVYIGFFISGLGLQFVIRWSPAMNLLLSFILALALPPGWSFGFIIGSWISCSFVTFKPEQESQFEEITTINWRRILLAALWTFAGFLLTLIFLWRLKISNVMAIYPREVVGWVFFALVELCLYRIIAKLVPRLYRIPLGYGIAVLNFLMVLFWILPFDIWKMGLILLSLLIICPLVLVLVDAPFNVAQDPIFRRK